MGIKRFSYFYKQRKLPTLGDELNNPHIRIDYLLPGIDRKKAGIVQRSLFVKKDNRIVPTRSGMFYMDSIKDSLRSIFSIHPSEKLNILSSYPESTFAKRNQLFGLLGVVKGNKPGHIMPPTTEEIHLNHLLKNGKDKVWSMCNLFRKSKRPSWAFAEGFPRFDMTWLNVDNLSHVFPKAKQFLQSIGFREEDIGVLITVNGVEKFMKLDSVPNSAIAAASRTHFLVKSEYSDYHVGKENYLALLDLAVGRANDFVNDSQNHAFVSMGTSINRMHLLQIEKKIKHRPFDLVVVVPTSQAKTIASNLSFAQIKKQYPRLLLVEMDDNNFGSRKIGGLVKYSHEAISEYSGKVLIWGPVEQKASNPLNHIVNI